MKQLIEATPECPDCKAQLALIRLLIDITSCEYMLETECIACGKPFVLDLSLCDFIDLENLLRKTLGQNPDNN